MKVVGIIAEYNPFHNGHAYQIAKAKEMTGADYALVVMSGNYVQRGTPAMFDKHLRTHAALLSGADCVLELPVCYATASGTDFAWGAVSLLDRVGVCDFLCFGSESGDIKALTAVASVLARETEPFQEALASFSRSGMSYPAAVRSAVSVLSGESAAALLDSPNNTLGIQYLSACIKRNSVMIPVTLKRKGNDYREKTPSGTFSSASALRGELSSNGCSPSFFGAVPEQTHPLYLRETLPLLLPDDFSLYLFHALSCISEDRLSDIFELDKSLSRRIIKHRERSHFDSFSAFADELHTKDTTRAHINRALLHLLLDIRTGDVAFYRENGTALYARILGFRRSSAALLSAIKENSRIPVLAKYADAPAVLKGHPLALSMLKTERRADDLYRYCVMNRYHLPVPTEERYGVITV